VTTVQVEELRSKREEIVIEHMESENRHQFDVTTCSPAAPT
jgi:hypothetical protein